MASRETKVSLLIGIPVWSLNALFLAYSEYPGILFDITILIMLYFVFLYRKKKHIALQTTKIGVIFLTLSISTYYESLAQPSIFFVQENREMNPGVFIAPEDEYVQELKARFDAYIETNPSINGSNWPKYSTYYDQGYLKNWEYAWHYQQYENVNWTTLDVVDKSMIIDWYVRKFVVNWTSDQEVYGVSDYKATPHEILQQLVDNDWTKPAKDDCDGQAAVTVSLLRAYGINAYIGDGRAHWFTVVDPPEDVKENRGLENVIILNVWQTVHLWSYFDGEEFYRGQSYLQTGLEMLFLEDEESFQPFYDFADRYQALLYLGCILAALFLVFFLGYPRKYKSDLHKEENDNRKRRKEKLFEKFPWLKTKWNPLTWVFYPILYYTYVRTGNPFRKIYWRTWLNWIITSGLILIPVCTVISNQGELGMHSLIYINLYIFFTACLIERNIFVAISVKLTDFAFKFKDAKPSTI